MNFKKILVYIFLLCNIILCIYVYNIRLNILECKNKISKNVKGGGTSLNTDTMLNVPLVLDNDNVI